MENIELENAIEEMLKTILPTKKTEVLNLASCLGRIACEDIYAGFDNPPFDRSPLDGYALISNDTTGATKENPIKLVVIGEVSAGEFSDKTLQNGQAIRIMTGAMMPKGSDCVIRQETTDYGDKEVYIYQSLKYHENYCFAGEDVKKGSLLVKKGDKLTHIHLGVLAGLGVANVAVYKKIVVALMTTGDEITPIGKPLAIGKIYNSNQYIISARIAELGFDTIVLDSCEDTAQMVADAIKNNIDNADLFITTGGVSVGKKDILHETIQLLGATRIFWRIKMKPGTPAIFSIYKNKPILSLSGNPFAAIATFELLARPLLEKLSNDSTVMYQRITSQMKDNFNKASFGRRFIRAKFDGQAVSVDNIAHSSGVLGSMIGCNCLIDIKSGNQGLLKGDKVEIVLL